MQKYKSGTQKRKAESMHKSMHKKGYKGIASTFMFGDKRKQAEGRQIHMFKKLKLN